MIRTETRITAGWFLLAGLLAGGCTGPEARSVGNRQALPSALKPAPPAGAGQEGGPERSLPTTPIALRRVVLDAGHGGHDTGALGPEGVPEKDVALSIARRLKALLEARGVEVLLTRPDDGFVPLPERARMANAAGADLFLSIHCNAARSGDASGEETFAVGRYVRDPRRAHRFVYQPPDRLSLLLARCIQAEMARHLGGPDRGVKTRNLSVLRETVIPGALAEVGFISNTASERQMTTALYRQRIAEALCAGVAAYARER
jgi:N-acetylmuramoyl-L-alanine amidase